MGKKTSKKYELTDETMKLDGATLHRIRAVKSFANVKKRDLGGWVEKEENLSQDGNAWVYDDAQVCGNARVCGNAQIYYSARIGGNAWVYDDAHVGGNAQVCDDARLYDKADVCGSARVSGAAQIYGEARVCGIADVCGSARVGNCAWVGNSAHVCGNAWVNDNAQVGGNAIVCGDARVFGRALVFGNALVKGKEDYMVFKNCWSSGRYFTYTRSNKKWLAGCFYGTGKELIEKAYKDSKLSGKCYAATVEYVRTIERLMRAKHKKSPTNA